MSDDTRYHNGAQDAQIQELIRKADRLFDLHDGVMRDGLPQCALEKVRIDSLITDVASCRASIQDLAKQINRITIILTICGCALFGAEKVANWMTGNSKADDKKAELVSSHAGIFDIFQKENAGDSR